jgi:hypothetical protein
MASQSYKLELGDKPAAFIITRLGDRWSPPITAGVAVIISLFSSVIIALVTGRFFPGPGYRALSVDYYYFIAEGLTVVIWFYYIWICKAPFKVLQLLQEAATVVPDNAEFNKARTLLKSQLPTVLAGVLALALAFPSFYQMSLTPPIWFNANPYAIGFRLVIVLPTIFAACSATLRLVVNTYFFGLVFNTLVMHPLHPDRACGLRPFGRYAVRTTYPWVVGGIVGGFLEYLSFRYGEASIAIFAHLAVALYLLVAPAAFFVPMWVAHSAMVRTKENLILPVSRQFDVVFDVIYDDMKITLAALASPSESFKNSTEKLKELQNLHELTQKIPTWPLNLAAAGRSLIAIFSPVYATVIGILIAEAIKFTVFD